MTAQPVHIDETDRVPRNAEGIAAALSGERRMEFYRELPAAVPEDAGAVLRRWWCEAMLDTDPAGDWFTEAALAAPRCGRARGGVRLRARRDAVGAGGIRGKGARRAAAIASRRPGARRVA